MAACLYIGLVAFTRLVLSPAWRRVVASGLRPAPAYEFYERCKAVAVTIFLTLLGVLLIGVISSIVALVRHRSVRRRAWLALGLCLMVLLALACTN